MNVAASPRSLFTFSFDCFDEDERIVASFQHRAFRSSGSISVDGGNFAVTLAGIGLEVRDAVARRRQVLMIGT